ncbi:hypothetical protein EGT74_18345 [Chitinophaga lutea]|uniref:DUF4890 domain-containing protein n=1 Tax=Chitinophaga lutea TaxID=2488634 RepID=A0A3N4QB47_9BACT|nr:hypothetical protein [Chitinophaga lutea]RPE08974.1 hypothetical protein EGT74_18345 [Chitinophaga lutea]
MKKILFLLAFALAVNISAFAQQGGGQRRTVEERVKMTLDRMKETLQITPEQTVKLDSVFSKSFRDMDKAREDARSSGNRMDREAFQKFATERDDKVKGILNEEQYKKYKAAEEERRQRMGNRGGAGGGNGSN